MPPAERFDRLEGPADLPGEVRDAVKKLDRFDHLEIGTAPVAPSAAPAPAAGAKRLCRRCGEANEAQRTTCWACFKPLDEAQAPAKKAAPADDITVVIDGATYRSSDPNLPDDVAELIKRIRARGYSPELLAEWRSWRVTRHERPLPTRPFEPELDEPAPDVNVFKGQRVNVIRLDGKVYTSDDPNLPPELKDLFDYVDRNGVTPALMDLLRQYGRAKYRPATTAAPSDGDLAFWKEVNAAGGPAGPANPPRPAQPADLLGAMAAQLKGSDAAVYLFLCAAAGFYLLVRLTTCAAP